MKAISGCPVCRVLAAFVLVAGALLALGSAGWAGEGTDGAKKVNVHYCKCVDTNFGTPEGKDVHCPCGMHEGKWCKCGHPHKALYHVGLATDAPLKKGEKRTATIVLKSWGEGNEKGDGDAKTIDGAKVEVMLASRGEVWVCPMKCAESETTEKCPVCHMKMKKGEGWKAAGAAVAATPVAGKPGTYAVELTPDFAGKARVTVSAQAGADPVAADFEVEIAE